LIANLIVFANYSIWVVGLPLFADERFDASAERIGTLLLAVNIVHIAAALPVGRLIRRWGAAQTLIGGFAFTAVGLVLSLAAPGFLWLFPPMFFFACGQVAGSNAAGDLVLRLGGRGGRAVGMVRLSSDIGLVAGPAAVGALADVAGYASPFVALSLLSALAAFAAWRVAGGFTERQTAGDD
jgi:MFS family permease